MDLDRWGDLELQVIETTNRYDIIDPRDNADVQNHPLIENFLTPVEEELKKLIKHPVSLKRIRQIIASRHNIVHQNVRSVIEQRIFLDQLKKFRYHDSYPFADQMTLVTDLLIELDIDKSKSKLRRIQ